MIHILPENATVPPRPDEQRHERLYYSRVPAPNRRHNDALDELHPAIDREDAGLAHAVEIMPRAVFAV